MEDKISSLCILDDYDSVQTYLKNNLNLSRSFLKKNKLPKTILEKKINKRDRIDLPLSILNNGLINPKYIGPEIKIIFEDSNFLVISKPCKSHSHPLDYKDRNNCLSFLRENLVSNSILNVNINKYDRGLLYRLDYETSGLLILTKKDIILESYRLKSMTNHLKEYIAIVYGKPPLKFKYKHEFEYKGVKKNKAFLKEIKGKDQSGMIGTLLGERILYNERKNVALIKLNLIEGLRHQIRAQLFHENFQILGEKLYTNNLNEDLSRLYLHAYRYSFTLDGKNYEFVDNNIDSFKEFF